MAKAHLQPVVSYLRRVLQAPDASRVPDAQLLERFVARREDAAFELLVWRHERMVLGVCQRLLRDQEDIEDAFQATFLILARKAGSIGKRESVASWLYKVAFRCGLRAKTGARKRAARETHGIDLSTAPARPEPTADMVWRDLRPVLDQEINSLPEKYRQPVVLCYLEGKTYGEAASQLGCSAGTISTRLTRARELLRRGLGRHGVILSSGALALALCTHAASAAVPATLVNCTVEAALLFSAGEVTTGPVSGHAAILAHGVLKTMVLTKFRIALAVALILSAIAGGSLAYKMAETDQQESKPRAVANDQKNKPEASKEDAASPDVKELQGQWRIVEWERDGKKRPAYEARSIRTLFTFKGEVLKSAWWTGKEGSHPFKLDPTKNPKTIDITLDDPWKYQIVGIYRLEGGRLRFCYCFMIRDHKRPTEFETQDEDARNLLLLERVQPKGTAQKPRDAAADGFGGILHEWRQPERAVQEKFFKVFNSAKTPDERKKVEEQRKADEAKMKAEVAAKLEPLADRCLKLAETYPDTPAGLAALCWAVSNAPATKSGKDALAILKQGRIARADLDELADAVGLGAADWHIGHAMTPEIKQALAMLALERVKRKLDQPRAAQLLDWVCTCFMDENSPEPHRIFAEAADLIVSRFADSPDINHLAEVLGVIRNPPWAAQYEKHLRAILKANQHSHVRLEARFALAAILQGKGAEHEARKEYEQFVKERDDRARLYAKGRKDFQPDPWEGIFNDLAKQAKNELAGMLVRGLGESPEIDGEDLDGRPMKLSDFRGKVVLVSFWATWCGPCMKFVPQERSLLKRLDDKPFAIVGVNGDKPEELAKALEKTPVTWRSFKDKPQGKKTITDEWKILAWPTLYLLDHHGVIRKRWIGAPPKEDLDREVDKLVQAALAERE